MRTAINGTAVEAGSSKVEVEPRQMSRRGLEAVHHFEAVGWFSESSMRVMNSGD